MAVPVLIISGSLGSGKTTVLGELHDLLTERDVAHAAIELDALTLSWPHVRAAPFNTWIGFENLRSIWANYASAGFARLLIAAVVESREELAAYQAAVPGAAIQVCRLVVSAETMLARLRVREPGTFQATALYRAPVLAQQLAEARVEDFVVDNDDRPVRAVAEEILRQAGWS
jgi:hypothetical protein